MTAKRLALVIGMPVALVLIGAVAVFVFVFAGPSLEEVLAATNGNIEDIESMRFVADFDITVEGEKMEMSMEGVTAGEALDAEVTMDILGEEFSYGMIVIDETVYMQIPPDTRWLSMSAEEAGITSPESATTGGTDPSQYLDYLSAYGDAEDLGKEKVDGVNCYHYRLDVDNDALLDELEASLAQMDPEEREQTMSMMSSATMTIEVWIATSDELPRRMVVDMQFTSPGEMAMTMDMRMSDYNTVVDIEAPAQSTPFSEAFPEQ